LSRGKPVMLAFRGERVSLRLASETASPGTNQCGGTVEACVYLGTYQDCMVRTGSLRVHAMGPGDKTIESGDSVTLSIKPDDCVVFGRDQSPG
jgi:ABC-type Fe3+/spermidine/putrescine transport system ATPase subunit